MVSSRGELPRNKLRRYRWHDLLLLSVTQPGPTLTMPMSLNLRRLCDPRSHEVCLYRFRCASNNCKAGLYRCGLEKRSKLKASVSTTFIIGLSNFQTTLHGSGATAGVIWAFLRGRGGKRR